jgi:hypothetical protein
MTRLIGVWKPESAADLEHQDILQAAFLRVDSVGLSASIEDPALAAILDHYAAKAVPVPSDSHGTDLPPGMQRRTYRVLFDLTQLDNPPPDKPPPDPFASPIAAAQAELKSRLWKARDALVSGGVAFPEGSRAFFDADTYLLTVDNTPQNLETVQSFLDSVLYHDACHGIVHVLHIIRADGTTLRRMAADTAAVSDHTAALAKLEALAAQGKATFVSSLRLETRSGQSAEISTGEERMEVTKFRKSDPSGEMTVAVDSTLCGTTLEIEPVVGPDGWTIDSNVTLVHHYLPPTIQPQAGPDHGKGLPVEMPGTETHAAKAVVHSTFLSGVTRLIALWKPEATEGQNDDSMEAAFLTVTYLHFPSMGFREKADCKP